jgi:putative tricarboxylic transport membrane protein
MSARVDFVVGLSLIVLMVAAHLVAGRLPRVPRGLGPGDYPRVVINALLTLGALLAVSGFYRLRKQSQPDARKFVRGELKQVFVLVGCIVLYLVLVRTFGYLVLTPIFMVAMMYLFGLRKWVQMAAIGVVTSVLTYVIFNNFLYVLLPRFNLY